jgi:hypothetical protein
MDDEAADAVVPAYRRHLEALGLKQSVKRLAELNPHDGYILGVDREASHRVLRLRLRCGDIPSGYFDAMLAFAGAAITPDDFATLSKAKRPADFEILCDEVDREGRDFVYRLLLHPSGEVVIRFDDVEVVRTPVADRRAV